MEYWSIGVVEYWSGGVVLICYQLFVIARSGPGRAGESPP